MEKIKRRSSILTILLVFVMAFGLMFSVAGCEVPGVIDFSESEYQTDTLKTEAQIRSALGNKYYVDVEIKTGDEEHPDETETFSIVTDGTYLYTTLTEDGVLLKLDGNDYLVYARIAEEENYTEVTRVTPIAENLYDISAFAYMLAYTGSFDYTSKRDVTFLNRPAVEYTVEEHWAFLGNDASYTEKMIIDNATGICLKHSAEASANANGEHGSATASFECTKFFTGDDEEITTALEAQTSKIAVVAGWDTDFLTHIGLQKHLDNPPYAKITLDTIISDYNSATGNNITSNVKFVRAYKNYDEDMHGTICEADYYLNLSKEDGEEFLYYIASDLYNGGASRDFNSAETLDNLYNIDDEGDYTYFDFFGYITGHITNSVEISATFSGEENMWIMTLSASNPD